MNKYKKRRLEKELSTQKLANLSGVGRSTIIRIESGLTKKIYDTTIYKLEKVLGDLSE